MFIREILPTPQTLLKTTASKSFDVIKEVARFAIDCLVMVSYLLEHAHCWMVTDTSAPKRIFGKGIFQETHNYAKLSELWSYVKLRRNPESLFERAKMLEINYGLTTGRTHIWTSPHSTGMCQGAVTTFYEKWFETPNNIDAVAMHFEGGVPIEGAKYQQIYMDLENTGNNRNMTITEVNRASFELASLKADILHSNAPPKDILNSELSPGAYNLTFPTFGILGGEKGRHTIAFIVREGGDSYFYDPNWCIAEARQEETQATLGRLLGSYTGFDYSENLDGIAPGFFGKAWNFVNERSNPPAAFLTSGIDLIRITGQTP